MLNTQRRDYADPYMWCCGCIPPVRLNPICYRFGQKKRGAASARVWAESFAIFMLYYTFHCFYIMGGSEVTPPLPPLPPFFLAAVFLSVHITKRTLAYVFSSLHNSFIFPSVVRANPRSPCSSPINVGPIKHMCGFSYRSS